MSALSPLTAEDMLRGVLPEGGEGINDGKWLLIIPVDLGVGGYL